MRTIKLITLIIIFPFYLLSMAVKRPLQYITAYVDYLAFKRAYRGKDIPLSGYQLHRWQIINRDTHPFYRPIWLYVCKHMRCNPVQLQGYYLSRTLTDNGADSEHTRDLLTKDNFFTYQFDV